MNHTFLMMCVLLSALLIAQTQAYNEKRDPEDHFNTAGRAGRGAFRGFTVVRPMTVGVIDEIDARDYCDDDIIPEVGVSKECLVILDNIAWQVQINAYESLCPRATFGALIVNFNDNSGSVKDSHNRSCGRILSTNNGVKTTTDITEHSEIDGLRRLAYQNEGQRANTSLWRPLSVITPGSSCPMDAAAIRWGGLRWHVASLTIADLIALNFTQINVEPEHLFKNSANMVQPSPGVIKWVNREANIARFGYRNILSNPCLPGCSRPTPTSLCTDDVPFVANSSNPNYKLIPDVNYYVTPGVFDLI